VSRRSRFGVKKRRRELQECRIMRLGKKKKKKRGICATEEGEWQVTSRKGHILSKES